MKDPSASLAAKTRAIFLEALELPEVKARLAFVEQATAENQELRAAVFDLLKNHCEDGFLETPATGLALPATHRAIANGESGETVGEHIGPYILQHKLGEGGCGAVYLAEQTEPLRRPVAFKIIKLGMDTKAVVARFEAERQALALMDHPNIAKIYDAGATRTGRPYFVMELVQGTKITSFCDDNQLNLYERLRLFIQVCQAVQHAHQKGIIHRDLKPSNILVTMVDGAPMPKIIDFGIAKATQQHLDENTAFTALNLFIGTPAYTSPEQAESSSLDIDTRSDIYSLGVLLYELLTGKTPFDSKELTAVSLDEMRRILIEKEPLCPSQRVRAMEAGELATTARYRQTDTHRLASLIQGDLDWVVLKAIEKDRSRRYDTASDMATDIQRHLVFEPVLARPPSNWYRFQKFARRHRVAFAAAGVVTATITLGLGFSFYQILQKNAAFDQLQAAERTERHLRQQAQHAQARAEAQELLARQKAYAADINLAQQALAVNNLGRAQELLEAQQPIPGRPDLRGWEWRYLRQQCQSEARFSLCQVSNDVVAISLSSDGQWVALPDETAGGLSIWNTHTRQCAARLPASDWRHGLAFGFVPNSTQLAYCQGSEGPPDEPSGTVQFWDASTGQPAGELPGLRDCLSLAFSPDGRTLLTGTRQGNFALWQTATRTKLRDLPRIRLEIGGWSGFFIEANDALDKLAFTVANGRAIRVASLEDGRELWTTPVSEELVRSLAFSPDGNTLASGAGFSDSAIRLWDVATGHEKGRLEGHRTWVGALKFWPDGQTLASGSGDQTIRLWDLRTGKSTAIFRGHTREVWSLDLAADGHTLISGSKDGTVCVWDTRQHPRDKDYTLPPLAVQSWAFAPDSQSVLIYTSQGEVVRCLGPEFAKPEPVLTLETPLFDAAISDDAQLLAGNAFRSDFQIWDLRRGVRLPIKNIPGPKPQFLPGSHYLLLPRPHENTSVIWDPLEDKVIASWPGRFEGPFGNEFVVSPDQQWLLKFRREDDCQLREIASGREFRMNFNLPQITDICFSPDHRYFAAVSIMARGGIWETATGKKVAEVHGFLQGLHSVAFSPDGKRLAIGSNGKEAVKLWSMECYQELLTLEGQGSMFGTLAFSPDGNLLAARNRAGRLHIWRAPAAASVRVPAP